MNVIKQLLCINLVLILIVSCEKDIVSPSNTNQSFDLNYNIEMEDALEIGDRHLALKNNSRLKSGQITPDFKSKKIKSKKTLKKEGKSLFHIINYEGGGFVIISADKRVTPILAYSESNNFEGEDLPGIRDWVNSISDGILKTKKELKQPRAQESRLWEIYSGQQATTKRLIDPPSPEECDCDEYYESFTTGQYIDEVAKWSQGGQYSWYSPSDDGCYCERKPAGCGAVAMAMLMNYYQHPYMNMSWNGENLTTNYPMPKEISSYCYYPSSPNSRQVAMLIRLCGSAAGSVYGILGNCATATYPGNINNALENMFYSNGGTWGDLDDKYPDVKNDLKSYHPVIFVGTTGPLNASNAHIWLGDGYSATEYEYEHIQYDVNGDPYCICKHHKIEMIGICWGQYNGQNNGFYLTNYSFSYNEDSTYDTYLRVLTGIRP